MNLNNHWACGTTIATQYRREADKARLIALAPRRSGHPLWARGLRNLAHSLSRFAESLDPAPARDAATWHGPRHPTATN